ncbi:MAG: LysR family transcriptional regulator [Alcaligenaceae bacterium]|nr:MAG: LysR family transcriptional regulator [Alcaligenaceae bacterium]
MTPTPLPYAGLRVLDISQGIAGPYCAHILWQQGAHVLKVEPPVGDWIRFVGVGKGDLSALAIQFNAGKQALALDARTEAGKKVLFDLALQADVIVQNFRPGVADRLGVGYATLSKIKPDLVYVSVSGYGQDGPYANAPATDSVMQADSGLMFSNQDEQGIPRRVGLLAVDVMTGLYASQGAATALYQRLAHKLGTHVQVSLFEACTAFQGACFIEQTMAGKRPFGAVSAPNAVFDTLDGKLSVVTVNTDHFHRVCKALDREVWITDPRYLENEIRFSNRAALQANIAALLKTQTTAHWVGLLQKHDVLHAQVRNYTEVLEHPQAVHLNLAQQLEQAGVGKLPYIGLPSHPLHRPVTSAPRIGEHSIQALTEAGLNVDAIQRLLEAGIVTQAPALAP